MNRLWFQALLCVACSSAEEASPSAGDDTQSDVATEDTSADGSEGDVPPGGGDTGESPVESGTWPIWSLDADLTATATFYDQPWPSDSRLTASGTPDVRGYPYVVDSVTGTDLLAMSATHHGFPVLSAAYFRFSGKIGEHTSAVIMPASIDAPALLVDIDPDSPLRGQLIPIVAETLPEDGWTPSRLLGLAPRPGFVLEPGTTYAYVIKRSFGDAEGKPLGVSAVIDSLARGAAVGTGAAGEQLSASFGEMFETLDTLGVLRGDVAGATVFTTSDVVAELFATSTALVAEHTVTVSDLHIDPDDGAAHARFCELRGTVTLPQFQVGTPAYFKDGLFDESEGLPKVQRTEEAPIVITLPKDLGPMPAEGFPLVMYFHGSGNYHWEVVDRGKVETPDGPAKKGEGPAFVLAPHGFAAVGFALPLNPERYPGASDTEYLNIANPKALRDTFRQGAIEARMVIEALSKLTISPEIVAGCTGLTLPAGAVGYQLDVEPMFAMGNSMGGMYANIVSGIEPRIRALAPSGAGGFWTYFILDNPYQPVKDIIGTAFWGTDVPLTLLHPAVHLSQNVLSVADPIIFLPRLGHRPLEGHPARSVYEPVGKDDKYFPTTLFDAIALGYGNEQAGTEEWTSMQEALTRAGHGGIQAYPVANNLESLDGRKFTGAVVQYNGAKEADPHSIISQLDTVKYQYGCFLETMRDTGTAVLPEAAAYGTPCPTLATKPGDR